MVLALALAACGGGGDKATDAPVQDATSDPNASAGDSGDVIAEILTPQPEIQPQGVPGDDEGALEVPLPGTLVASATEDPDAGLIFDQITFTMSGGANDTSFTVELLQNGTVTRDGVVSQVGTDVVYEIDAMLDELNFFGLQGSYLGPPADEDVYQYRIEVVRGGASRLINAQDGYLPTELKALFARLADLGLS
jgi:hypothetical protein